MSTETFFSPSMPFVLRAGWLSRSEFLRLCRDNPDLRLERTAEGDLCLMTPTTTDGGFRSGEVFFQLKLWSVKDGTGMAFDSSTGYTLPNGAIRSPDSSWVERRRYVTLSDEERNGFASLAPDFAIEVRSKTDRLTDLREKLKEYVENGVRLGWLIDPLERRVEIYRPRHEPQRIENPTNVTADPELPGFTLDLTVIWA